MPTTAPPIVLCLLVCDGVHTDPRSGKRFLLGTITEFQVQHEFGLPGEVWVHTEMTNGHGRTPIEIRISRLDPGDLLGEEVLRAGFELYFPEPRDVLYLAVRIATSFFLRSGEHWVTLLCEGVPLLERRLEAQAPPGELARKLNFSASKRSPADTPTVGVSTTTSSM